MNAAAVLTPKEGPDDPDVPPLMGAMFDGAGDPKLGLFGLDGFSELSSSSIGRPSKRGPKREKIEIRNSNVHIYNTTGQDPDSTKEPYGTYQRACRKSSDDRSSSDLSSPRAHMFFQKEQSCHRRNFPPNPSHAPVLRLRGGAPGSYNAEDLDWENGPASESSKQRFADDKTSSRGNFSVLGPSAKEIKDWKPNPGDWGAPSGEARSSAWNAAAATAQNLDPWDATVTEPAAGSGARTPCWDPVTNPTHKRDVWGQIITDEQDEDETGASHWHVPFQDNVKQNDSSNVRNNHGSIKADAWDTHRPNTANNNGVCNIANGNGNQSSSWGPAMADRAKPAFRRAATARDEEMKHNQATAVEADANPWLSLGKNSAKGSRSASAASRVQSPLSTRLTSSFPKADDGIHTPLSGRKARDKLGSIPGAWSPPLNSPRAKDPISKDEKSEILPPERTVPSSSIPKAPKPKLYWSSWNKYNPPPQDGNFTEQESYRSTTRDEEPIYTISAIIAQRERLTHQVRPMRASTYSHKISTPTYMDTHEDPYAIFVFKYRDQAVIENMLGKMVEATEAEEKIRLAGLSKEEIIEELMKAKASRNGGEGPTPTGDQCTSTASSGSPTNERDGDEADGGNAYQTSTASKDRGKNPKDAGPWRSTEAAADGSWGHRANQYRTSATGNERGWGSNGEDNNDGAWGNNENGIAGGSGFGNNNNNNNNYPNGQWKSWSNEGSRQHNDSYDQADHHWDSTDYNNYRKNEWENDEDKRCGNDDWGNNNDNGGYDWNNGTSYDHNNAGGWDSNAQERRSLGKCGGDKEEGDYFQHQDEAATRWGASSGGAGDNAW